MCVAHVSIVEFRHWLQVCLFYKCIIWILSVIEVMILIQSVNMQTMIWDGYISKMYVFIRVWVYSHKHKHKHSTCEYLNYKNDQEIPCKFRYDLKI